MPVIYLVPFLLGTFKNGDHSQVGLAWNYVVQTGFKLKMTLPWPVNVLGPLAILIFPASVNTWVCSCRVCCPGPSVR